MNTLADLPIEFGQAGINRRSHQCSRYVGHPEDIAVQRIVSGKDFFFWHPFSCLRLLFPTFDLDHVDSDNVFLALNYREILGNCLTSIVVFGVVKDYIHQSGSSSKSPI
jgi:hypothetical protein